MSHINKTTRQVVCRLADYIRDNELEQGDSLPSETELGKLLSVGRSTIREALSILKALGILNSKTKVGLFVAADTARLQLLKLLNIEQLNSQSSREICELRTFLLLGSADALLTKATRDDLDQLHQLVLLALLGDDSPLSAAEFSAQFHQQLAAITGNTLFLALSLLYQPLFAQHLSMPPATHLPESDVLHYLAVIEALESNDRDKLRQTLQKIGN